MRREFAVTAAESMTHTGAEVCIRHVVTSDSTGSSSMFVMSVATWIDGQRRRIADHNFVRVVALEAIVFL